VTASQRSVLYLANKRGQCSYRKNQRKTVTWLAGKGYVREVGELVIEITDAGRLACAEEFAPWTHSLETLAKPDCPPWITRRKKP
jgi:hypothetical protein